jgi:hypothetical protein
MDDQTIQLGQEVEKLRNELQDIKKSITKINGHSHSGYNFPQVSGKDLLGFRIAIVTTASVAPTFGVAAGVPVFLKDATDTYLWVNNGGSWKSVQLT